MLISSLTQYNPAFRNTFSKEINGADPGIRQIQAWMSEAWKAGYDEEGQKHFKGRIRGTKAWIGTADVAAAFLNKGIE